MARNFSSIHHSFLTSNTIAELDDADIVIFVRLILVSDDWGRFPDDPKRLKRMMSDFTHDPQKIEQTINLLAEHKCLHKYEVDREHYCMWEKWDVYQSMRFQNEAIYPSPDGTYESSTNPLSGENRKKENPRNKKKQNKAKQNKSNQSLRDGVSNDLSCDKSNGLSKEISNNQRLITDAYQENYIKTYGDKPNWTTKDFKHCQDILKDFNAEDISNAITFMFDNHDDLWSNNIGVFMSLTSTKLIQRALSKMRNPNAGGKQYCV